MPVFEPNQEDLEAMQAVSQCLSSEDWMKAAMETAKYNKIGLATGDAIRQLNAFFRDKTNISDEEFGQIVCLCGAAIVAGTRERRLRELNARNN